MPSEDSDEIGHPAQSVWSESSLTTWRKLGFLATLWAHSEDWSDWVDAQADLRLRWAHRSFCWFCHEATQLYIEEGHRNMQSLISPCWLHCIQNIQVSVYLSGPLTALSVWLSACWALNRLLIGTPCWWYTSRALEIYIPYNGKYVLQYTQG